MTESQLSSFLKSFAGRNPTALSFSDAPPSSSDSKEAAGHSNAVLDFQEDALGGASIFGDVGQSSANEMQLTYLENELQMKNQQIERLVAENR